MRQGDTDATWDQVAASWERWSAIVTDRRDLDVLTDRVAAVPGARILDLATGPGEPALRIAAAVGGRGQVIATDSSSAMIDVASRRARAAGLDNIDFRVAPAERLRIEPGSLDGITSACSLPFFDDPQAVLASSRRWLRAGGRLALSTWVPGRVPLLDVPARVVADAIHVEPAPDPGPGTDWPAALERAGFTSILDEPVEIVTDFASPREWMAFSRDLNHRARSLLATRAVEEQAAAWTAVARAGEPYVEAGRVLVRSYARCLTAVNPGP